MFLSSIENIVLLACVFFVHTLLKLKPYLLFPLKGVPFLKLVKTETKPEDKKIQKKFEKENPTQNIESFQKGVQIGEFETM
jgi:hypothetical protein